MTSPANSISVVPSGGGDMLSVLGAPMFVKAAFSRVFVVDHVSPPGHGAPLHTHDEDDEVFFILEGTLTLSDGTREFQIGPGETACFPHGAPHSFRNDTMSDVRFIVVCSPGVQVADFFAEMDREGKAGRLTPDTMPEICARYGVNLV